MNSPQDFCCWLQGFVELQDSDSISDKQWLVIKDHLKLVFDKKTPDRSITISAPEIKIGDCPKTDFGKLSDLFVKQCDSYTEFPITAITC